MRLNRRHRVSVSDKFFGRDAFTISRALSNVSAPMMKRSSAERAMIWLRTILSISGDVPVTSGIPSGS